MLYLRSVFNFSTVNRWRAVTPELSSPLQARKWSTIFALTSVFQQVINSLCPFHLQDFYPSRWEKIRKPFLFLIQIYLGSCLLHGNSQHCVLHCEWKPQTNSAETRATKMRQQRNTRALERQRKKPQRGIFCRLALMKSHGSSTVTFTAIWFRFCFVWQNYAQYSKWQRTVSWEEAKHMSFSFAPRGDRQSPNIICAFKQCTENRLRTFSAVILSRFLQVLLLFLFRMPSVRLADMQHSAITHFWSMSWVIHNLWKYVVPFPCQRRAHYSH